MSDELSKYINILFLIGLGICLTILLIFQEHYFARNLRFLLSHAALKHTTLIVVAAAEQFVSPCVLKVLPSSISFKVIRRSLWEVTASYETHTVIFIKKNLLEFLIFSWKNKWIRRRKSNIAILLWSVIYFMEMQFYINFF